MGSDKFRANRKGCLSVRLLTEQKCGCQHSTEVFYRDKNLSLYQSHSFKAIPHCHSHSVVSMHNDPSLVAAQGGSIKGKGSIHLSHT